MRRCLTFSPMVLHCLQMAANQGYPKWLLDSKEHISSSDEWNGFLRNLHDAIQQQLTESHVQYFTDLSEPEKQLFMERATKAIEGGAAYSNLFKKVSVYLDQNLNEEVSRQLLEEQPIGTKSDLVIDFAEDGALSLLKKWPEMKTKIGCCLNQPLPFKVRQLAWRLYLTNTKVRKQYVDLLNSDPRKCISQYDYEIDQKCQQLLNSEITFRELRASQGVFYGMKAVLSYYHATMKTKARLRDVDHMLVVPFLQVSVPNLPKKEPPSSRTIALLVEEFITFLQSRPGFVIDSNSELPICFTQNLAIQKLISSGIVERAVLRQLLFNKNIVTKAHEEEMKGFVDKVAKLLQRYYPEVPKMIADRYVPSKDKIVATEAGSFAVLKDGLTILIRPLIRAMFIGYLNLETLLYVWDQYMIGLDTPGFNVEWLAIVTAIILGLLRDKFKGCQSSVALETTLKNECPRLTIPQFQYEVKKEHYQDLYAMLQKDFKSAMPVLDPTQAGHPPWRHWYNDLIPPYNQPADRRTAREERDAERERLDQQKREASLLRKDKEDRDRKRGDEEFLKVAAAERQRVEYEKMSLEEKLAQERRMREEAERRAREAQEQLNLEMGARHRQPSRPPSNYSVTSYVSRVLFAPPPSQASYRSVQPEVVPVPDKVRTPTPAASPTQQFNMAMKDFLWKIAQAQNKIAHAEGSEKDILDKKTEGYLHQNIRDIKQAQIELFGRKFEPGEFDKMAPAEQQDKSDKMMSLIQQWREERRAEELKQNKA